MIKVEKLFQDKNIPYSSSGKHSTANHVNIKCPFCGQTDPSYHLGISVENGAYHCWRDSRHAGYNFDFLLSKLLKISRVQSQSLISKYSDLSFRPVIQKDSSKLWAYMDTFEDAERFESSYRFLKKRGFGDIPLVCQNFGLKYSPLGDFSGRIILPIMDSNLDLVSFTGRDVTGCSSIRYKTLSSSYSKKDPKDLVFNLNRRKSKYLVIVEGPLDAILIEHLIPTISAWALMGLDLSLGKIENISDNLSGYERIFLLLDNDQLVMKSIGMAYSLKCYTSRDVKPLFLPDQYKDVGEMNAWEIPNWFYQAISIGGVDDQRKSG